MNFTEPILKDRVIAVTGGLGTLGGAVIAAIRAAGAQAVAIDKATNTATAGDTDANLVLSSIDLGSVDATAMAFTRIDQQFGRLDGLVNLAGGFRWETLESGALATWDLLYQINLRSAVSASQAALPLLLKCGRGRIINVSAAASTRATLGMGAYAASKSGVSRLTESLADELKDRGITVNAVLPSIIDTPQNRRDMPDADFERWVHPTQLADVIVFLLSDRASAINGALIPVVGRV